MHTPTSEYIWQEYHQKLRAFIRTKVTEDAVDDLLQEVFLKVHRQLNALKDDTKLESWLYQITRHVISDHYRNRNRHLSTALPEWLASPQIEEEELIRQELATCLEPMIEALPDKYRRAIYLSVIEHQTQQHVADSEGISLSGAKSRVQRGRALLKALLYDCCEFEFNNHQQLTDYYRKPHKCQHC